jgi:hypothetical protein
MSTSTACQLRRRGLFSDINRLSSVAVHLDVSSSSIVTSSSDITVPTFDPVMNYPALSSFLLIFTIYAFLQIRIFGIEKAAKRRREALQSLRKIKALQLSSLRSDERPSDDEIESAVKEYEEALIDEDRVRTVLPGVRIVAPNGNTSKEDIAAAKQFLGKSLMSPQENDSVKSVPPSDRSLRNFVLGGISICLIALLFVMSFDPMEFQRQNF